MTYNADNTVLLVLPRELSGVVVVPGFTDAILEVDGSRFVVVQVVRLIALIGREAVSCRAGDPDDTDGIFGRRLSCGLEEGSEKLCEEKGSNAVGAQLQLIALLCLGSLRGGHDARIVEEDVKLGLCGEELLGRAGDGGQVCEVQLQKLQGTIGRRVLLLDGVNGCAGLVLGASGDPDGRILAVEDLRNLLADACVCASDETDAAR